MPRKKNSESYGKNSRQNTILRLISSKPISTQKELSDELEGLGFSIAQATLSRDIRSLHLIKAMRDGVYCYQRPEPSAHQVPTKQFHTILEHSLTRVDQTLNQVVLHTSPGMAQALCASIDSLHLETILGTISGDDTILIICNSESDAVSVASFLNEF